MAEEFLRPGAPYKEFLDFFSRGKDIDPRTYDRDSAKGKLDLWRETWGREVRLGYLPEARQIRRHVRNVKVLLTDVSRKRIWFEASRAYPNGKVIHNELFTWERVWKPNEQVNSVLTWADWTYRETLLPGELPVLGALRALKEEFGKKVWRRLGYIPTELDFSPWTSDLQWPLQPYGARAKKPYDAEPYKSSAYSHVITVANSYRFELKLPHFIKKDRHKVRDTGGKPETATNWVDIHLRALTY